MFSNRIVYSPPSRWRLGNQAQLDEETSKNTNRVRLGEKVGQLIMAGQVKRLDETAFELIAN
ncbi:UNVERIFIED_CONTAM: hypothetical protein Sradi_7198800 [Sesamum radiatum]|uniref:Uncharacterized protein n=1 Tax=Sesamum radiatum TaxID=300843 RepID=A0AAW2IRI9_SESRA